MVTGQSHDPYLFKLVQAPSGHGWQVQRFWVSSALLTRVSLVYIALGQGPPRGPKAYISCDAILKCVSVVQLFRLLDRKAVFDLPKTSNTYFFA